MIFDAIGHIAVGQVPSTGPTVLVASGGSYILTGGAIAFRITEVAAGGSYSLTGGAIAFRITEVAAGGSYSLTGGVVSTTLTFPLISGGSYILTGFNANEIVFENTEGGSYSLTGGAAGFYRDFVNWFPVTEPQGSSWQGAYKPSSGWTTAGTSISNWTVDPDMNILPPERA